MCTYKETSRSAAVPHTCICMTGPCAISIVDDQSLNVAVGACFLLLQLHNAVCRVLRGYYVK